MVEDRRDSTAAAPLAGALLGGRYRLQQRIGRGGMADVFRAEDETLHRPVAIKVFRFEAGDGAEQQRFDAEVRLLASLRSPGLVTVFDAGAGPGTDSEGAPYLVMELIEGPTLSGRLADGALPAGTTAALGAQLAATLSYVHSRGIVHRDIKPANILLDTADPAVMSAKLTDFGIARMVDSTRLTAHGMTVGTANYLSPEQARTGETTAASDVYSLGLVLLECLTGVIAYPGVGVEAALARLQRPPVIPPDIGPEWAALLQSMTAYQPADRPSTDMVATALTGLTESAHTETAGTAAAAATAVFGASGLSPAAGPDGSTRVFSTPERTRTATAPTGRRHRPAWIALGGAAAVAVLAVAIGLATNGSSTPRPRPPTTSASTASSAPTVAATTPAATPAASLVSTAASQPAPPPPGKSKGNGNGKKGRG